MAKTSRKPHSARVRRAGYTVDLFLSVIQRVGLTLAGIALVGIMLVVAVEILGRYLLGMRVAGVVEITRVAMVICVFPALAYVQRKGSNVRAEALLGRLPSKWRFAAEALALICGLAFCVIVLVGGWEFVTRSVEIRERSVGVLRLPVYPTKIIFFSSMALLCLQYVAELVKLLRQYGVTGTVRREG